MYLMIHKNTINWDDMWQEELGEALTSTLTSTPILIQRLKSFR